MNAKLSSLGLLTTVVLLAGANQANASGYTFTDLTTLVGGDYSVATAINNAGQVVGSSNSPHATTWNGTTATDLGTLGGNYSAALAINNTGQVAGHSDLATPGSASHATLWGNDGTSGIGLDTPIYSGFSNPEEWSVAYAINDHGQVAGIATNAVDHYSNAALWNGTTITSLGLPWGGDLSGASAINNAGQVAGWATSANGNTYSYATVWNTDGTVTKLDSLAESHNAYPTAMNDSGQVAGYSSMMDGIYFAGFHATLWNGTTATDLGTLGGRYSQALGINEDGQVVGYSTLNNIHDYIDGQHATLWDHGTITDLNSFLDSDKWNAGWVLAAANGINDNGWIVGDAVNNAGLHHAFLLTPCPTCPIPSHIPPTLPIPEPETYAMFLAGLGLMGFMARRRKNGQA